MTSFRSRIIGAWGLVSYLAINPEDPQDILYPMGKHCNGQIIYTSDGYMAVLLQRSDIERPENDWKTATTSQLADAAMNTMAYCGPFYAEEVPGNLQTIEHYVRISLLPNWNEALQIRRAEMTTEDGQDILTLGPKHAVESQGTKRILRLKWRRLPENNATRPPRGIRELKM